MKKRSKVEAILSKHNKDLLDLNKAFINSMQRPRSAIPETGISMAKSSRKLSKKQLRALAEGRKILAAKNAKTT
jgi:hypothetical protein